MLAVAEELDRERRPERARAQRQRADRALDPLAIGQEGQLTTTFDVDVAVGAQPADRAQRRFDQLAELAGLLVEDEALHLEARDLQHLLQQTVEPLRLPLEDLDRPWIGGLALLDPAGERIRESLDAGERGLQLVRGEAQEAVLARLALGGGEHRARAAQQGLERLQRDRSLGREAQHHVVGARVNALDHRDRQVPKAGRIVLRTGVESRELFEVIRHGTLCV